ncbi:peptide/nickel transport system substrate-binding protein [Lentzea atacamensis]|uniref:Peptide/nickel transport system substrate-binding protein n=1 Tax=Lentzea atacamensis TaxID=531938 RepID=A0ABX9EIJ2_9PSEU|nr:ABC transporter substrate-binding protein [Lentzea atacamensis]RAS70833.1 peptide/nickel transport system substrate-binding protein [Lentzea atacamensis]
MLLRRTLLAAAVLSVCGLTAGCFAGSQAEGPARLRVALPFAPVQSLSPWGDDGVTLTRLGIAETLVRLDPEGRPQPLLAESWTRKSPTTWSFRIRAGVKFHDGTALTAAAAADALSRAAAASPVPRAIKGVGVTAKAAGDLDLEVSTTAPDPTLPQRLSTANLVVLAPAAYQGERVNPAKAGTGPFVLADLDVANGAALARFDGYWDGVPELAGVDVRFVPDGNTRSATLRAGEVDVATNVPISALANVTTEEVPLPRTVSVLLNTAKPPFADPRLRAAVREAVDPAALAKGVYEGHADAATGVFRNTAPRQVTPTGATAGGQKIALATWSDRPELPGVVTAVAESLRGKGFEVEQVVRKYSQLEPDLLAGNFDAVIFSRSYAQDNGDLAANLNLDFSCSGGFNLVKVCDPALDAAIGQALAIEDVPARQAAAMRAQDALLATNAVVPLVHERTIIGRSAGVSGLSTDPYDRLLITSKTSVS